MYASKYQEPCSGDQHLRASDGSVAGTLASFVLDLALYKRDECAPDQKEKLGAQLTHREARVKHLHSFSTGFSERQFLNQSSNMGQQGSKSSIEARVIFQRDGAEDACQRTSACSTPASLVRIQKKVNSQLHSSNRSLEKLSSHPWSQSRRDSEGLVYVMDNPTGGVWVKPEERWTRS